MREGVTEEVAFELRAEELGQGRVGDVGRDLMFTQAGEQGVGERRRMSLKKGRKASWLAWDKRGEGQDMKPGRVAAADPAGLVGLHGSYLLIMFESLC